LPVREQVSRCDNPRTDEQRHRSDNQRRHPRIGLVRILGGTETHPARKDGLEPAERNTRADQEDAQMKALGKPEETARNHGDDADEHRRVFHEGD
jgi:hypothetical protein